MDYLFAQPALDRAFVDWGPTCGNMLAGVGPFAIESGLVAAEDGETRVLIRAVNTGALIEAVMQTPGGRVTYDGDAAIAGVPGTAAPILLNFADAVGGATGKLMPTGKPLDQIEGVDVTCLDVCMPVVIARAADLGKTGRESAKELDADRDFMARIERIRRAASLAMGMGEAEGSVMPKFAMVGASRQGRLASRRATSRRLRRMRRWRSRAASASPPPASCRAPSPKASPASPPRHARRWCWNTRPAVWRR